MRVIHRSPVNFPHKGQWRRALMFSLICAWINGWVNNVKAGDLRRHRSHYNGTLMSMLRWHTANIEYGRIHHRYYIYIYIYMYRYIYIYTSYRATTIKQIMFRAVVKSTTRWYRHHWWVTLLTAITRVDARFALSQRETSLQSNAVFHRHGANQKSALKNILWTPIA